MFHTATEKCCELFTFLKLQIENFLCHFSTSVCAWASTSPAREESRWISVCKSGSKVKCHWVISRFAVTK